MNKKNRPTLDHRKELQDIRGDILVRWSDAFGKGNVITVERFDGSLHFLHGWFNEDGWEFESISLGVIDSKPLIGDIHG